MPVDFSSLRKAMPYLRAFRGQTFVVKLGGELCEDQVVLERIIEQVSLLFFVGIRLVLVHGGGAHASRLGEKLGVSSEFVAGRRVTSAEMLEVAKMSFAGSLNTDLVALFRRFGVKAVGLSGIDGNLLVAQKRPSVSVTEPGRETREVDFGFVGDAVTTDGQVITHLLDGGYVPVICPLAADVQGQVLNINADTLASQIAVNLRAEKLCSLVNVDGVMRDLRDPSTLFSILDFEDIKKLGETGVISGGMLPKLANARDAIERGVRRVHIINGLQEDSLLQEVFTNEGSGTMIVRDRGTLE